MSFHFGHFKSSVAEGVQNCIGQKWTHDDFSDFTVVVEDMEFHCHKFILSACSTFFNGLLRAEMRENLENRSVLKSMSKETFAVIINAVYKGENGLTKENIIQVWHATCFLDIPFLIEMCEYFVSQDISLTNFEMYYENAKLLDSKSVVKRSHGFMITNFQQIKDTKTFYELSADELCNMVDSHNLKVDSEDVVMESILQWINYKYHDVDGQVDEIITDSNSNQEYLSKLNNDDSTNKQTDEQNNCDSTYNQSDEQNNCDSSYNQLVEQINEEEMNSNLNKHSIEVNVCNEPGVISSSNDISKSVSSSIEENDNLVLVDKCETQPLQEPKLLRDRKDSEQNIRAERKGSELHYTEVYDRGNNIVQLLRSSRMFLVSRRCLENLTRNSVVTSKPDAMNIVYDALMYKYKAFNNRNIIMRYRECSNIINGVAFVSSSQVLFYDPLKDRTCTLVDLTFTKENFPGFVGLTAVNSDFCFTTIKVERVSVLTDDCRNFRKATFKNFSLYNMENKTITPLGKSEDMGDTFLLNYNDNVICIDTSNADATVVRKSDEVPFCLGFINPGVSPTFSTIFEDNIFIFYESRASTGIRMCTLGMNRIVDLPGLDGPADKMTSFQHGKYLYLLQKNGNLRLVTKSQSEDIEFTHIDKLWDFELSLHCAACYNKQLFVFGEIIETDQESKKMHIMQLQKRSLPDVFDSIKVVEISCQSQVVTMSVDKSRLRGQASKKNFF